MFPRRFAYSASVSLIASIGRLGANCVIKSDDRINPGTCSAS